MDVLVTDLDWETDSSSSEDQEEINYLYGGHALSILSGLEESIGKIDDFLSFDRAFVQGDVVCSLTDPSGQMGRVTWVDVFVDLENVHGKIFENINSNKLMKIRSISEGDYVVKGSWVGQVQNVVDRVTVLFDDGTRCQVTGLGKEKLLPLTHDIFEDLQYPYYPGLRVKVKSSLASKPARWLFGTWRNNQDEGTVCAVEPGLVYVNWLASALMTSSLSMNSPPCCQDSANLTLLSCFPHANWHLGDWCMLPVADEKEQMEQNFQDASAGSFTKVNSMSRGYERRNLHSNIEEIFIIGKIKTKVDIMWQDGQHSLGLDPQSLLPVNVINTHEFWPQQFVLEKGASDDPLKPISQRWGVVQHVDAKECTVMVQWKNVSISGPENLAGERVEETVSAYELVEHPDYSYCLGDIVIKAAQKQLGYQADKDHEKSAIDLNVEATLRDSNCISYQNEFPDNWYLSCIGNVTGFRDGAVEVKWATGLKTKVAPSEIFRIEKYEEATATPVPSEANVEELSQEMIEHEIQISEQKGKGMSKFDNGRENRRNHPSECGPFTLPRAALELFSSIKASIFQTLGVTSLLGAVSLVPTYEEGNGSGFLDEKRVPRTGDICTESHTMSKLQSTGNIIPDQEVTSFHENRDLPFSFASNNSNQFKQFDILDDCSDHHFFDGGKGFALSEVKRGWEKKVQQEWRILEKNLPETIFVRGFERRMDLLRAAIVGAPGTPYHDGLFFFDISFPPQYPNEPPMVHYISGGLRLNPNLYESGKVCLSLLNTWTGTGTEVWNPEASTILQVLLSLQALVLNKKPYFNEAGYDQQIGQAEGEKNSVGYNENAYLMTCKSMLYLLRRPPKHFEELVDEHFKQRSQQILLACKAYLEGALIGCDFKCGKSEDESQKGTSTGFKLMLAKLFPKLLQAFSDRGVDCSQFVELEERELCY